MVQKQKEYLTRELLKDLGNPEPSSKHLEKAERLFLWTSVNRQLVFSRQLTENEVRCLYLASKGYSAQETAEMMNIKLSTVDSYRKEIKRKLKCNSIAQAVYEGICFGYIPPKQAEEVEHPIFGVLD